MTTAPAPGPLRRYLDLLDTQRLQDDPAQRRILEQLQRRFELLQDQQRRNWLQKMLAARDSIPGLYIHGQVGRGKTMLMDLFARSLSEADLPVWRIHFHRFMDQIHRRLGELDSQRDPLKIVANQVATRTRVLCLDEFHVGDIGDAMILGGLLNALFEHRLTLITTSNTEPDQLYADGLQRARFLPAIEAIKHHCEVIDLDAREDYRLRELIRHPVYHHPDNEQTHQRLIEEFTMLAAGEKISDAPLKIRGHRITPLRRAGAVAWFDFDTLCKGPRASSDYIELARRFGTLFVSSVPQMSEADSDPARRFIHLVDECYDRSVKLIISAAAPLSELYTGKRLAAPFERTTSRLTEMQSRDYLAQAHRA